MTNYELPRVWSAADSNQGNFQELTVQLQEHALNKNYQKERNHSNYIL